MKLRKSGKLVILLAVTSLIGACGGNAGSSISSQELISSSSLKESSSSLEQSSSSKAESSSSLAKSSNSVQSSSSQKSSSSKSSSSSKVSSSSQKSSSSQASSSSNQSSSSSSTSQANPETCDNHELSEESIIKEASIIEKGIKRYSCPNCNGFEERYYYDLDECVFEDKSFMYDGKERTIYIEGMVPYGLTVRYENNTQTAIGSHEAKAKFYDQDNVLVAEKTANISVVENVGIPEMRIYTMDESGNPLNADPDYHEKDEYTKMAASLSNCDSKYAFTNKTGGIRVRGNSTNQSSVNKRAWRLKFDKKINLLGLNGGPNNKGFKSWVLMADNFDYSYFRNATAWGIGNDLFNYSGNYATKFQHVNVYMNDDYRGIYLVAEQQQANYGRVSIDEPQEDDPEETRTALNRGYMVEIDGLVTTGQSKEEYKFTTGNGSSSSGGFPWGGGFPGMGGGEQINGVTITDKGYVVKTDIFSEDQFTFIKKYIKGTKLQVLDENAELIDSPYTTQFETLNAVFDLESFFKTYVLQEFCKNYDCGWGSFYLFVDFSQNSTHKRLTLGAPWDFDLGLGNKKSDGHPNPDGDFISNQAKGGMTEFNPWLFLLSQTEFFNELFVKYYSVFANSGTYEKIRQYITYESSAFAIDFANEYAKWGGDSGRTSMNTRTYSSHQDAVSYLLNWLQSRKEYLDNKYL